MTSKLFDESAYRIRRSAPTCLDLFSGAGGLSVGFAMAGGRPLGAIDFDADSIASYRTNFPNADEVACGSIETWNPRLRPGSVDVVIGGPPCQGFSLARGQRFVDDPRNTLYKHFVRVVRTLRPQWIVMENVEGIINIGEGAILRDVLEDFSSIGYSLEYRVVNMAEYGVPQLRRRAIFVGNRVGKSFQWPDFRNRDLRKPKRQVELFGSPLSPFVAVNEALSDLVLPVGNFFAHRANSQMRGPRNRCAHTEPAFTLRVRGDEFALCESPATAAFIPGAAPSDAIRFRRPQNELQEFLRFSRPSWIKSNSISRNSRVAPPILRGTRRITVREQARLQTFPDWFTFHGKVTSQSRQIGNAVPALFSYRLFSELLKLI